MNIPVLRAGVVRDDYDAHFVELNYPAIFYDDHVVWRGEEAYHANEHGYRAHEKAAEAAEERLIERLTELLADD